MPGCQVPAAPRSSGDDAAALFPRPTAAHRVQVPPPSSRAQPSRMKRAGLARSSASAPQCLPASAATQQPADPVPLSLRPAHCHRADVNSGFFPVTLLPTLPNPSIPLSAPLPRALPDRLAHLDGPTTPRSPWFDPRASHSRRPDTLGKPLLGPCRPDNHANHQSGKPQLRRHPRPPAIARRPKLPHRPQGAAHDADAALRTAAGQITRPIGAHRRSEIPPLPPQTPPWPRHYSESPCPSSRRCRHPTMPSTTSLMAGYGPGRRRRRIARTSRTRFMYVSRCPDANPRSPELTPTCLDRPHHPGRSRRPRHPRLHLWPLLPQIPPAPHLPARRPRGRLAHHSPDPPANPRQP